MVLDAIRTFVTRRPAWIVTIWLGVAAGIGCFSPNLTRLAAEAASFDASRGRGKPCARLSWSISPGPTRHMRRWPWRFCTGPAV